MCVIVRKTNVSITFVVYFGRRKKVMDGLHQGAVYEELVSVRLVGMMMIIAVRKELRQSIRYAIQTVGTGALNFMVCILDEKTVSIQLKC